MSSLTSGSLALTEELTLALTTRVVDPPETGQARIRMEWAGVCGSDLHVLRTGDWVSYWPAILGHEGVGVVESCPGGELADGTRVVIDSRVGCGRCEGCEKSPVLCRNLQWVGEVFPGAFQEYGNFPVPSLVPCPAGIDPAVAVLAEPLSVALHAVNAASSVPDRVLILGFGPIGALVFTEVMRRNPETVVTVVEIEPGRVQLAQAVGASVDPAPQTTWQLVIDAAGYPGSFSAAIERCDIGGEVVLVGIGNAVESVLPQTLVEKAITIHGSHGFTDELPEAVKLIDQAPDHYRWIITDAFTLDEAERGVPGMLTRNCVGKAVIRL